MNKQTRQAVQFLQHTHEVHKRTIASFRHLSAWFLSSSDLSLKARRFNGEVSSHNSTSNQQDASQGKRDGTI